MIDYEELILARQEAYEISEDADVVHDDCSSCKYLEYCRRGEQPPRCPIEQ